MTGRVTLVTGFPTSFLATRMVRKILAEERSAQVRCVVQEKFWERAQEIVSALPVRDRERVTLLEGDVASMDMGLSGKEHVALAQEVQVIHHCAAATYLGVARDVAQRVNVDGVREVLELAREAKKLERLVHWSSALVSGGRRGYVLEDELQAPEGFRNVVEEMRFKGEQLVRAAMQRGLRTTILRPAILVGDSVTGEIDRFEGPYLLVLLMLSSPVDLRVPLPGRGDVPLNLVPIDYVVDAGWAIANDARSVGRTFHLVDPTPQSARRVFELIAQAAGRPLPRGFLPTNLATALLRTPGLERFAHVPRAFLEQLATEVVYDDRGARELLDPKGIKCPGFESYVDVMVSYVRAQQSAKRQRRPDSFEIEGEDEASDPLQ
ncbi:SDR family oxidoreductase [Sandaracinus amylolyticus]|uniref:SDR family oxidoreductase n=1 Tax=Sandaracinus amylolyticus TaxID=927083 RepID=UPI00069F19C2|nr:SDR family oxidoreductase [Sandaracinus amylolyticus]